jgi:hypothetical protein
MNGWKMAANICIIKLRLRRGVEQVLVNLWRHIAVTVNGTVDELDLESAEPLAITDRCQGVGMDRLTHDVGRDLPRLRRQRQA